MKGQTSPGGARRTHGRKWHLYLVALLGISLVCGAAQQPAARRRTPRGSRVQTIQFPVAHTSGAVSFETALTRQQEQRELPSNRPLKPSEIGQLAWAAQGVTVRETAVGAVPTQPPAPMTLYFTLFDGVYRYDPIKHALEQTGDGDVRATLADTVLSQPGAPTGGCQIVLTGSSKDFATRYGTKARTAMLLLAGQMVQNIQLQAMSLGLTFVPIDNASTVDVRRILRLNRSTEPLYVLLVGYPASQSPEETTTEVAAAQSGAARAVIITPQRDFADAELFETKRQLELASVQTLIASIRSGRIVGSLGTSGQSDLSLSQVKVEDFDAFIFIGGVGAIGYIGNTAAQNLVRQVAVQRKVLAASGNAPTILAGAGVLKGARVTALLSERARLVASGAVYTGLPVQRDGPLVTSTGAAVVPQFVTAIVEAMTGQ